MPSRPFPWHETMARGGLRLTAAQEKWLAECLVQCRKPTRRLTVRPLAPRGFRCGGMTVKKTTCILLLCSLASFAQIGISSKNVQIPESATLTTGERSPTALTKIYSNLGPKDDAYNASIGYTVQGPNAGALRFWALPFTPKANAHVSEVRAAVQYGSGANQVNLSIYADSGGTPGTLLVGPVTVANLSAIGTCCSLAVADFSPLAVSAGTKYWMVADTPLTGAGSDFSGQWEFVHRPLYLQAYGNGSGWFGFDSSNGEPAGEVLGSIP